MSYTYNQRFIDYTARTSTNSATEIVRLILSALPVQSVLDVGCARGTWLKAWMDASVCDVQGIDGDYISRAALEIPAAKFMAADLTRPVELGRTFDIVQSFEVAEHIATPASEIFIQTLTRHSRGLIVFSAAVPGQGGEYHVNEQTLEFWRDLMRKCGYLPLDWIRPRIAGRKDISFWYRYNTLIYAHKDIISSLPQTIRDSAVLDGSRIPDMSPRLFQIRKAIIRTLPTSVQLRVARIKAHLLSVC